MSAAQQIDTLPGAIMNLPCQPGPGSDVSCMMSYKIGHRDARHAAAELASCASAAASLGAAPGAQQIDAARKALEFAEYLAKSAEAFLSSLIAQSLAKSHAEEEGAWGDAPSAAEADQAVERAKECVFDHWRAVEEGIFEFRKRAEKVSPAAPALGTPAPVDQHEPTEAEQVCGEAYQAVGCMLSDLGLFETEQAGKLLDNLSQARMVHQDVLPWPSIEAVKPEGDFVALVHVDDGIVDITTNHAQHELLLTKNRAKLYLHPSAAGAAETAEQAFERGRQQGMEQANALWELAKGGQEIEAAAPALTDERIDYIADVTIKAMPEGIRGFMKVWGWQQFARNLLDICGVRGAPAVREPLTPEQIHDGISATRLWRDGFGDVGDYFDAGVRFAERAHGIQGKP